MELILVKDYQEVSNQAADIFIQLIQNNPSAKLGFATGSSPIGLYKRLIEAYQQGKISFQSITTFNLDEYVGIEREHPKAIFRS
jgi:glucosamine-6-phosphate deaminase